MTDRLLPPGAGAPRHPYGLRDGARVFRKHSTIADAQRRFRAAAEEGASEESPHPDPPPQAGEGKEEQVGRGETEQAVEGEGARSERVDRPQTAVEQRASGWMGRPPGEVALSLLTHRAREL